MIRSCRQRYRLCTLSRLALVSCIALGLAACDESGALTSDAPSSSRAGEEESVENAASTTSDASEDPADDGGRQEPRDSVVPADGSTATVENSEGTSDDDGARVGTTLDAAAAAPGSADPLSDAEEQRAIALVLDAAAGQALSAAALDRDAALYGTTDTDLDAASEGERVAAMADGPSYRVLYSQRFPAKDGEGRAAEVMIYRYDTGETLVSKVDLQTGAVEALDLAGLPAPIVPEEIAEAAVVARADEAVRERLIAAGLDPDTAVANGLLTGTDDADSSCATNRCLRLFFSSARRPVPEFSVIVDLVRLEVVDVADMPGGSLNE